MIEDLIVEKTISNDTFYLQDRMLKNDTDEAPRELFTEQMDQEKNALVATEVKLLLLGSLSSIFTIIIIIIIIIILLLLLLLLLLKIRASD